ncbi:hypothetical protein ECEC1850_2402, partial [Escherichia coli EC1850]
MKINNQALAWIHICLAGSHNS